MNEATKNPFVKIHDLLRGGSLSAALNLLYSPETGQINEKFLIDRNHAWYTAGDIFFRQHKFLEAISAFQKSLRTRPDDVDALMAIGNCYDELKRPKLAERYFRRALDLNESGEEQTCQVLFNLANALFDQRRFKEAAELYQKLERAPLDLRRKARKNYLLATGRSAK